MQKKLNFDQYIERRKQLVAACVQDYAPAGVIALFGAFERDGQSFRQESSFYYFTGIREPGLALLIDVQSGKSTLYTPNCGAEREKWVHSPVKLVAENAAVLGFDDIEPLGAQCPGYQMHTFFPQEQYQTLLNKLQEYSDAGLPILTLMPNNASSYIDQRFHVERLKTFVPALAKTLRDISPLVATMRRKKSMQEIELTYKAIELTALAQEVATQMIAPGVVESEVQAGIEYIFTGAGARLAFPSIVATGKNATILHYTQNDTPIMKGDLVVVDIGAEYEYYCADITRTYPASGSFTKRQRELYDIVLETQEYIASIVKPGMWLSHKDHPEQSLNHLAKKFLDEKGYNKYFPHGIGHFLGLDVHDVGDSTVPLQLGDVITIEPGIYIPEEGIGIRIEDDYWIVEDGAVCLSDYIPKAAKEIESLMKEHAATRAQSK